MWNGGHDDADDADSHTRNLAASAIAAYQSTANGYQGGYNPAYETYAAAAAAAYPAAATLSPFEREALIREVHLQHQRQQDEDMDQEEYLRRLVATQQAARNGGPSPEVLSDEDPYGAQRAYDDEDEPEAEAMAVRSAHDDHEAVAHASVVENSVHEEPVVAMAIPESEAASIDVDVKVEADPLPPPVPPPPGKKKRSKKKSSGSSKSSSKKKSVVANIGPTLDDPAPPITEQEYQNIEALMVQFCKVPLLAEFSRPVSLLHPELMTLYSKIVKHPIDLGEVCRGIRRRTYKNTRAIRLDMWRIFTNCIKYHSHPSNKDGAVPAFISIALHLREYFNALWEEYLLPSDPPKPLTMAKPPRHLVLERDAFAQRNVHRSKRSLAIGMTMLSGGFLRKSVAAIKHFFQSYGKVDELDEETLLDQDNDEYDMQTVISNLRRLCVDLEQAAIEEREYVVDDFVRDVKGCYEDIALFEYDPHLRVKLNHRMTRLMERLLVPIYEASCRGVNQSSIWGCMAATIWARESGKKPYWPALVLGILAPEDQKEDWHFALTERNEARLTDKLRGELMNGKKKSEQALKRQKSSGAEQMSFFLVEFMGTHEFIWVRESDIIENFDPDVDPNVASAGGNITKKKRSRTTDNKTFTTALEEARWALEEFELQLTDTCGDLAEEEGDEEGYSFGNLALSDDEIDDDVDRPEFSVSDTEEANELLATNGLFDFTSEGIKNRKKTAIARKKQKQEADREASKKAKAEKAQKAKDERNAKRRKAHAEKRKREAEAKKKLEAAEGKSTKSSKSSKSSKSKKRASPARSKDDSNKKSKRSRTSRITPAPNTDKRRRAMAISKGFVYRISETEDLKTLGLSGVLNIPASVVDSSGLLGRTLAFLAAAGEVPMPDNGDEDVNVTPWDIDVDELEQIKSSKEREEKLAEQVKQLKKRIASAKESTKRRRELTKEALERRKGVHKKVYDKEYESKREIMRRKKKGASKSSKKSSSKASVVKEVIIEKEVVVEAAEDNGDEAIVTVEAEAAGGDAVEVEASAEVIDDTEGEDAMAVEAIVEEE
uniref:Bromo domain-containing protein n=1 Tax=Grammatophora oceanica TaxID=210454 RepID=A0A7S1VTX3_9STRA|mmetsp:Transcript_6070/g.8675  ORF Transcript_6070/g.8675 Transcript_6070/m.8675 type:complete len:1058 (+) Transcript_6070:31-3204(+)|eukprot:CAMPEP_0194039132 /NCGR_PEP_ID=MMETSP0009_2-20130614/11294_1 /TAXON_ID=210454 /ORGANISM="Grammatophora oceanica, Strain CCMP 410" /LENGTH=1057 /DNA_ID=CAMNT_0038681871 /DNA_START=21 /DNA_END=3194 /DNA_ORIENTATION=+